MSLPTSNQDNDEVKVLRYASYEAVCANPYDGTPMPITQERVALLRRVVSVLQDQYREILGTCTLAQKVKQPMRCLLNYERIGWEQYAHDVMVVTQNFLNDNFGQGLVFLVAPDRKDRTWLAICMPAAVVPKQTQQSTPAATPNQVRPEASVVMATVVSDSPPNSSSVTTTDAFASLAMAASTFRTLTPETKPPP